MAFISQENIAVGCANGLFLFAHQFYKPSYLLDFSPRAHDEAMHTLPYHALSLSKGRLLNCSLFIILILLRIFIDTYHTLKTTGAAGLKPRTTSYSHLAHCPLPLATIHYAPSTPIAHRLSPIAYRL